MSGASARTVSRTKDGSVRVTKRAAIPVGKRRRFLHLIAEEGKSTAAAAKAVGVSLAAVARMRREDAGFAAEHDDALEALGFAIEDVAIQRALVGREKPVFSRSGEQVGVEFIPSDRLHEKLLEANHARYKREEAPAVVVLAPLSAAELVDLREVGRENVDAIDVIASRLADAEREREVKALEAGR